MVKRSEVSELIGEELKDRKVCVLHNNATEAKELQKVLISLGATTVANTSGYFGYFSLLALGFSIFWTRCVRHNHRHHKVILLKLTTVGRYLLGCARWDKSSVSVGSKIFCKCAMYFFPKLYALLDSPFNAVLYDRLCICKRCGFRCSVIVKFSAFV